MASYDYAVCSRGYLRNPEILRLLLEEISRHVVDSRINIMEVCGGQTASIVHYGLEELLPANIKMIHGPGCPVCVTPQHKIETAIEIAKNKNVIMCSFGDMIRVPGLHGSLGTARSEGADVRIVYSPLDCIDMAIANPNKEIVFFAVGFETTIPIYAILLKASIKSGIKNLSLITSLFTVPPAVRTIVGSPDCRIDALLAAGHVCAVMGEDEYRQLSQQLKIPIAITGFEPTDILQGILCVVKQIEKGIYKVENPYYRIAHNEGNIRAQQDIKEFFTDEDSYWRGIGVIKNSGKRIADKYELYDAIKRFLPKICRDTQDEKCISGLLMRGVCLPIDCTVFGTSCTPEHPLGAPMVSSEGICAAYFSNCRI